MAFTKVPKLCQDAPAGFQTFNAINQNLASLDDQLALEHVQASLGGPALAPQPGNFEIQKAAATFGVGDQTGRHDHPLIAVGAAVVLQTESANGVVGSLSAAMSFGAGAVEQMRVIDTGIYFFPISGFSDVRGKATPMPNASLPTTPVDARVYPAVSSGPGTTGLLVYTFMQQEVSGIDAMLGYHTGFSLVVYGRHGELATVTQVSDGSALARRRAFAPGPMHWFPSRGKR